jgi:hypothetical protein
VKEALKHLDLTEKGPQAKGGGGGGGDGRAEGLEGRGLVSKIHWFHKKDIAVCLPPNDRIIRNDVFLNPWTLKKIRRGQPRRGQPVNN